MRRMLTFDPAKRITVHQALEHPFMSELHCSDDEPIRSRFDLFDFEFEKYDLAGEQLKDVIYDEIMLYHSKETR
jgi:mitogen-activated protein kinase 1/3